MTEKKEAKEKSITLIDKSEELGNTVTHKEARYSIDQDTGELVINILRTGAKRSYKTELRHSSEEVAQLLKFLKSKAVK